MKADFNYALVYKGSDTEYILPISRPDSSGNRSCRIGHIKAFTFKAGIDQLAYDAINAISDEVGEPVKYIGEIGGFINLTDEVVI